MSDGTSEPIAIGTGDGTIPQFGHCKKREEHPVLEEFTCTPPALRFVNFASLAQSSQDVLAQCNAILVYRPADHFTGLRFPHVPARPVCICTSPGSQCKISAVRQMQVRSSPTMW
jgi:hypothetical protein